MPFQIKILRPAIVVGLILVVLGCASFQAPAPATADAPFKQRAQTQQDGDIRVTAVVLSAEESKTVFGFALYNKGIQPIWLEIENKGDVPVFFLLDRGNEALKWPRMLAARLSGRLDDSGNSPAPSNSLSELHTL